MFREAMTYAQGHMASKRQGLYANLNQKPLTAWIWAFPAAWKLCFCHPDVLSVITCPLPWRIISSDWVVDFDFPPWWCCPQLEAAIVLPWILGHTLISPVLSIVPPCLFFFFFPPMAQMARFRVSCLREWGATALVKEPEAELIIVITASYVYNTSQAEGAQGQLLHCHAAASLETPEQGLGSGICLHQSGPPQMQGGRRLCCWRWASARLPESLQSDSSQAQQVSPCISEAMC